MALSGGEPKTVSGEGSGIKGSHTHIQIYIYTYIVLAITLTRTFVLVLELIRGYTDNTGPLFSPLLFFSYIFFSCHNISVKSFRI